MTKDVGIAAALAHGLGQPAVVADTVHDRLQAALDELGPQVDHSAAIKHWSGRPDYRGEPQIAARLAERRARALLSEAARRSTICAGSARSHVADAEARPSGEAEAPLRADPRYEDEEPE